MISRYYVLENGLPKAADLWTWSAWADTNPNRDVKRSQVPGTAIRIITVFFVLPEINVECDDDDGKCRESLWFYGTMVFGGTMDGHEEKYVSREAAEDGHERILNKVGAVLDGRDEPYECCKKP